MKLVLQTLGMRQWGTGTLRDEKQTRQALWMLPVIDMTEDSRLRSRKGRPRLTSWIGGLSWETWENGVAHRVHRTGDQGEEGCTERGLWGAAGGPHGAFSYQHKHMRKLSEAEEDPPRQMKENSASTHTWPGIIPASAWLKKFLTHRAGGSVLRRVLPQ